MQLAKRHAAMIAAVTCGTLVVAGCSASTSGSPSNSPTSSADYAASLTTQINEVMKQNAIPGAVVTVETRDKGNFASVFGTSEIGKDEPMSMDDFFRIGSNTKTMTSTVILQLAQEGKLQLNDPVSKYEPKVPNGQNITIAQLSEMRSGLYSYTSALKFNQTLDKEPQKAWTPSELLAIAFAHKPNFAPGAAYEYSNTNIVILGEIIEKLTGMTASQAFQKRIFEPLSLTHTSLPVATDSSIPDPHAQGYQFGTNVQDIDSYALPPAQQAAALNGTLQPINNTNANPSWAWTAGGAISTLGDLATYSKALSAGTLLSPKYQKIRLDSIKPIAAGATGGPGYGLGIAEFTPGLLGHDGQIPGYSTFMATDTARGITIIIGTNLSASPVSGENAAVALAKPIIATLYGSSSVPGGDPAAAGSASASTG